MTLLRLPVSGFEVDLRQPAGDDDLLLAESSDTGPRFAVEIMERLAPILAGPSDDNHGWEVVPLTDMDVAMLHLRRLVIGDLVRADIVCPAPTCRQRIDVSFRVSEYLNHHRVRRNRDIEAGPEPGWYRLPAVNAEFRLPTSADLNALAGHDGARRALADRLVRPRSLASTALRRVEAAMEAMSPNLSGDLGARCPECGSVITVYFDVQLFTLMELRGRARGIYEEIHLLASGYHWREADILALPASRRNRYADMLRSAS
jgi:hypothetical protein